MTSLVFRAPVCAGCGHEFVEHIMDRDALDRVREGGECTQPACDCRGWVFPEGARWAAG